MDLFEGDEAKIDEMNRRIAAAFGFECCFTVCGQTYPRKVDSRILNCLSLHRPERLPHGQRHPPAAARPSAGGAL